MDSLTCQKIWISITAINYLIWKYNILVAPFKWSISFSQLLKIHLTTDIITTMSSHTSFYGSVVISLSNICLKLKKNLNIFCFLFHSFSICAKITESIWGRARVNPLDVPYPDTSLKFFCRVITKKKKRESFYKFLSDF